MLFGGRGEGTEKCTVKMFKSCPNMVTTDIKSVTLLYIKTFTKNNSGMPYVSQPQSYLAIV